MPQIIDTTCWEWHMLGCTCSKSLHNLQSSLVPRPSYEKKIEKGSGQKGRTSLSHTAEIVQGQSDCRIVVTWREWNVNYERACRVEQLFFLWWSCRVLWRRLSQDQFSITHLWPLLPLSKGDRPAKVCVRACVCGYPHVENYFRLHSAGTRKCDPFDQTLSRFFRRRVWVRD